MKIVSELYSVKPVSEYTLSDDEIQYEEGNGLRVSSDKEVVKIGQSIKFEVKNISDEEIIVSPGKPYTLLKKTDSGWEEIMETSAKGVLLSMVGISPGNIETVDIIVAKEPFSNLENISLNNNFTPGEYRFIYLGRMPFLAIDFIVSD